MPPDKQETQTTQTATATPEERELNKLLLEQARAGQAGTLQIQESGQNLINQLLTGQALPGYLQGLPGGISPDVTNRIVQKSLEDVRGGLQMQGLFDSGVRAELETQTAADIRTQAEQFNLQNIQQLLNLATGGQAQNQALIGQGTNQLGQSLAGLRTTTGGSTTTAMNPFLKSFQQSAGEGFGNFFNPQTYIKPR